MNDVFVLNQDPMLSLFPTEEGVLELGRLHKSDSQFGLEDDTHVLQKQEYVSYSASLCSYMCGYTVFVTLTFDWERRRRKKRKSCYILGNLTDAFDTWWSLFGK
jgi:hypothetical protein